MGPFSPRPVGRNHQGCKVSRASGGAATGLSQSALRRHKQRQSADSIDLTDSVKELDQEFLKTSFRSTIDLERPAGCDAFQATIPLGPALSRVAGVGTEAPFNSFSNGRVSGSICAQQAQVAGQHHVAVRHREIGLQTTFDQHRASRSGHGE